MFLFSFDKNRDQPFYKALADRSVVSIVVSALVRTALFIAILALLSALANVSENVAWGLLALISITFFTAMDLSERAWARSKLRKK